MKICWDNLENLYLTKSGNFRNPIKKKTYIYVDSCENCKEPFLKEHGSKGLYCSRNCQVNGKGNPFYGKHYTEKTKKKISDTKTTFKNYYWKNNIPLYDTYAQQLSWCEPVRRNIEDKNILEVKCAYCGKWYIPSIILIWHRIQIIKGNEKYTGESRFYCSKSCKQECPIFRQILWPKGFKIATSREVQPELRQMVLKRDNYKCIKCGSTENLHCHHIEGIRWEPLESADIDKCITLCKSCHKVIHKKDGCGYRDFRCDN